jgi:hypothetical protein
MRPVCITCRRRKVACDRQYPCKSCYKSKIACRYLDGSGVGASRVLNKSRQLQQVGNFAELSPRTLGPWREDRDVPTKADTTMVVFHRKHRRRTPGNPHSTLDSSASCIQNAEAQQFRNFAEDGIDLPIELHAGFLQTGLFSPGSTLSNTPLSLPKDYQLDSVPRKDIAASSWSPYGTFAGRLVKDGNRVRFVSGLFWDSLHDEVRLCSLP